MIPMRSALQTGEKHRYDKILYRQLGGRSWVLP